MVPHLEALLVLALGVAAWAGFVGWHAGRLWSERLHLRELAALRLEYQLTNTDERPFVDLAAEHGLLDEHEVTS